MTSGRYPAKAFAVFSIVFLLAVLFVPLIEGPGSTADFVEDDLYITYESGSPTVDDNYNSSGNGGYNDVVVKYDGVAIAEYNPQFWSVGSGTESNSICGHATLINESLTDWYGIIDYRVGSTIVFTGWTRDDSNDVIDPGDRIPDDWFRTDKEGKRTLTLTASWDSLESVVKISDDVRDSSSRLSGDDPYTHIVLLDGDIRLLAGGSQYASLHGVTIRSSLGTNSSLYTDTYRWIFSYILVDGIYIDSISSKGSDSPNVIIDNVRLVGSDGDRGGHGSEYGIYAQGNKLIMGVGITGPGDSWGNVTIYGGNKNSTCVESSIAIFSGQYANVYGGSHSSNVTGKTDVRIIGGTILDTVCGGNNRTQGVQTGSTNILIVGGSVWDGATASITGSEYQTVVGGSRQSDVGTSNVTIAGLAEILAVQGGGRSGNYGETNTTNVTVCGNSTVVYLVCGSVTDGNSIGGTHIPVQTSNVIIAGSATIGGENHDGYVFAGGWDTNTECIHPSTNSTNLEIKDACKIYGSAFGGGFRGSIGAGNLGDVNVSVSGGYIRGSLYGGGSGGTDPINPSNSKYGKAGINGKITISIKSCKIDGSVYGGGLGINDDGYRDVAQVIGNVTISIDDSEIGGSVFGGGQYGRVGPDSGIGGTIAIDLGKDVVIEGDVFAGGYGQKGVIATNVVSRTITVDGADVHGSVYGGSREGNDNCKAEGTTNGFTVGNSYIYIRSGDIATGSSGNVYGGSYRGYSNMNVYIYVGVPALDGGNPSEDVLKINSIYGGASVGEGSGTSLDKKLLIGDTRIEIGNLRDSGESPYGQFSVSGDVFGEGDYCAVDGSTEVIFNGFKQESNILSIQKASSVTIIGSSISISGNIDGSTTDASEKLSLNLIDDLVLQKHQTWGVTSLTLYAAASQIGGFGSLDTDGSTGDAPDISQKVELNTITLRNGMLFSILGNGNSGDVSGDIRGYTLISNGGSSYYGTFAMGVTKHVDSSSTGFFVKQGDKYAVAQRADYEYSLGNDDNGNPRSLGVTMWYIAGVYKVETTMVLTDDPSEATVSAVSNVMAPKTISGSKISFVGGYVNSNSPGSLTLVDEFSESSGGQVANGSEFKLILGKNAGPNYLYVDNDGFNVLLPTNTSVGLKGNGININIEVTTKSGFNTTGYAGTVTLHMVEMLGNILVNSFDIEVSVYLRISQGTEEIEATIVMRPSTGNRKYSGSTDIYIPALDNNEMALYYTSIGRYVDGSWQIGAIGESDELKLMTVPTNLNKNGWQSSEYSTKYSTIDSSAEGKDGMYLGVGGVYSPVIRFQYDADPVSGTDVVSFDEIILTVWEFPQSDSSNGEAKAIYTLRIQPEKAEQRDLTFMDTYLVTESGIKWSEHQVLFSLQLDFGTDVGDIFVAVNSDFRENGLSKVNGASDYIECVKTALMTDNSVLMTSGDEATGSRSILFGSESQMQTAVQNVEGFDGDSVMTIEKFLELYVKHKPDTPYDEDTFEYTAYPRWYDTKACLTLFNFDSVITTDLDVYAGYSITITVHPFTDLSEIDSYDGDCKVSPETRLIGLPGTEVDLMDLYGSLTLSPGYTAVTPIKDGDGSVSVGVWYDSSGRALGSFVEDEYLCSYTIRTNVHLYLYVELAEYDVTVKVKNDNASEFTTLNYGSDGFNMVVNGKVAERASAHYSDDVVMSFNWSSGYRIGSVEGTVNSQAFRGFDSSSSSGVNTLVFDMPDGDLTIEIVMTDKATVTVNLKDDGVSDNGLFSVSLEIQNDRLKIGIYDTQQGSGVHSDTIQVSGKNADFVRNTAYGQGAFLISAFIDGKKVIDEINGGSVSSSDLSEYGDEIVIDVYVHVKWSLSISGSGYQVERYPLIGPREGVSSTYDGNNYTSEDPPLFVLTGDRLVATSTTEGLTLTSLVTTNLDHIGSSAYDFTYTVLGLNATMSSPVFEFVLTIELTFEADGEPIDISAWMPQGTLTVSSASGDVTLQQSVVNNKLVFAGPCDTGTYNVSAIFVGFNIYEESLDLQSSEPVQITMDAIEFKISIQSPVDNHTSEKSWYVHQDQTVGTLTSGCSEADVWVIVVGDEITDVYGDTRITVDLFGSERTITLYGIPFLDGMPSLSPMDDTIVVTTEGSIDGTYDVGVVEGLSAMSFSCVYGGSIVAVSYSVTQDSSEATLVIDGVPDGTGCAVLSGNGLTVLIISVPELEAVA